MPADKTLKNLKPGDPWTMILPELPAILADLLEQHLPQPAAKMFSMIRQGPVSAIALAVKLGMQPRGGHWNTGMSTLRRNGLVEEREGRLSVPQSLLGGSP